MMGSQFIDLLGCFLVLWLTGGFTVKFDSDDQMDVIRVQGCSAYSIISYHRSLRAIKINKDDSNSNNTNTDQYYRYDVTTTTTTRTAD